MRTLLTLGLFWTTALCAAAVQLGDSHEAVLVEKGAPTGSVGSGDRQILRYPDQIIRIQAGRVIGLESVSTPPTTPPAATSATAAKTIQLKEPSAGEAPPPLPKSFVGSPEFHTAAGVQSAGTAFLATRAGDTQVYLLTVRHLLGPDGGFASEVAAEQVPVFVYRIRLQSLWGGARLYTVKGLLVPPPAEANAPTSDLAIFKAGTAAAADAAPLAERPPAAGEPVWVIARVRGGVAPGTFIHRATAAGLENGWLLCEFENSAIVTNGASGAPVVDAQGRVVGIYRGHSKKQGKKIAHVIPSETVLRILRGE